jgi:DNA-binding transcriptional LysR family regulator
LLGELNVPDLNSLMIFAKVVEASSFSEAARRMNMPIQTVSRRIADLEEELGVRLLERTTRNLRVTDVGLEVLQHARSSVELNEAVDDIVSNHHTHVSGLLRLSAPPNISESLLAPLISAFQVSYPDVRVQVLITDRIIDHIADGVDITFRLGELKDSTLVARKLLTYRHLMVASPEYIKDNKMPGKPEEMLTHRIIAFSHWTPEISWKFNHVNGKDEETVTFAPYLSMNDFTGLNPALLSGIGIGSVSPIIQPELLRDGRLVEIMPDWRMRTFDLSLVHLGNRHISRPVRVFKEFATQMAPTLFPNLPI